MTATPVCSSSTTSTTTETSGSTPSVVCTATTFAQDHPITITNDLFERARADAEARERERLARAFFLVRWYEWTLNTFDWLWFQWSYARISTRETYTAITTFIATALYFVDDGRNLLPFSVSIISHWVALSSLVWLARNNTDFPKLRLIVRELRFWIMIIMVLLVAMTNMAVPFNDENGRWFNKSLINSISLVVITVFFLCADSFHKQHRAFRIATTFIFVMFCVFELAASFKRENHVLFHIAGRPITRKGVKSNAITNLLLFSLSMVSLLIRDVKGAFMSVPRDRIPRSFVDANFHLHGEGPSSLSSSSASLASFSCKECIIRSCCQVSTVKPRRTSRASLASPPRVETTATLANHSMGSPQATAVPPTSSS